MFTRADLCELIDKSERGLRARSADLRCLRAGLREEDSASRLTGFQSALARTMYDLETAYAEVHKEKRQIISRKAEFSPQYIRRRLKTLASFIERIKHVIDIGKILGDSFAWLFYSQDKAMMAKQYETKREVRMPTGVGGAGELAYISSWQVIGRHFILYHGVTTFLRFGDISFFDLSTRKITAIGELKSKRTSASQINVTVHVAGHSLGENLIPPSGSIPAEPSSRLKLKPREESRLKRQLTKMTECFRQVAGSVPPQEIKTNGIMRQLAEGHRSARVGRVSYLRADDGLLLLGMKFRDSPISSGWKSSRKPRLPKFEELSKQARQIVDTDNPYNQISIRPVMFSALQRYYLQRGMCPLFWWPVGTDVIEDMLFQKYVVMALYNHAFLIRKLERLGLSVVQNANSVLSLDVRLPQGIVKVLGLSHYGDLIQSYLIPEDAIFRLIEASIEQVRKSGTLPSVLGVDFAVEFN